MAEDAVIEELAAAVERSPELAELRLHLATLLVERHRYAEALAHCSAVLARDAANTRAVTLLQQCSAGLAGATAPAEPAESARGFDWTAAEKQVADIVKPAFVSEPAEAVNENDFDALQRT
nr:ATP-binding protein [Streptomyces sp. DSM 41633]